MKSSITLVLAFLAVLPSAIAHGHEKRIPLVHRRQAAEATTAAASGIGASFVTTDATIQATAITVSIAPAATTSVGALAAGETSSSVATSVDAATSSVADVTTSSVAAVTTTSAAAVTSSIVWSVNAQTSAAATSAPPPASTAAASGNIDNVVLNLALQLENLESQFYSAALAAFPISAMTAAGLSQTQSKIIIEQIQSIQKDESTHASVLTAAIQANGGTPVTKCSFNFAGTLNDPITFLSVARSVEQVGVSAYLGAASLLSDKSLLTAAGSILTLEARHQSLLNVFSSGSYNPQSFDIALLPQQVLALAGGFLQGCDAADLSLTTNQPLAATERAGGTTRFQICSQLNFASTVNLAAQASTLSCQMFVGGNYVALVFPAESCIVPSGINGPVSVILTNSSTPLQSNLQTQDQATTVAGPALIFVDSVSSTLGSLFTVQTKTQTTQTSGNQNSIASANLGQFYQTMIQKGNTNSITIVQQTTTTTETTVTENSNSNSNSNSKSSKDTKTDRKSVV